MPEGSIPPHESALKDVLTPASFLSPEWYPPSAWTEHAPFAFWIVDVLRPRSYVELGTSYGYSYFAVCQIVEKLGLETECTAIDTWRGDDHSGFYSDHVYNLVREHAEKRFPGRTSLKRMTFDEALPSIADNSIDLLHVDGRHYYEDAKHDYETWVPKLTDRAVVLFHDTQVFDRGFGVHRLWKELSPRFPSFEFHHGHGLGVLGVGRDLPEPVVRLLAAGRNEQASADIRTAYARLGSSLQKPARRARRKFKATWKDRARIMAGEIAEKIGLRAAS